MLSTFNTTVTIVGAGATGLGLAAQLTRSGVDCVVIERDEPGSGATFHSAGILHSGARYAVLDPAVAGECRIAQRHALEHMGGTITCRSDAYYLILDDDGFRYADQLRAACERLDIATRTLDRDEVLANEPQLQPTLRAAIAVPDYVQDPILLVTAYGKVLKQLGTRVLIGTEIERTRLVGARWHLVVRETVSGALVTVRSEAVVVAAGGWTPQVLKGFDVHLPVAYVRGSMFVINDRLVERVICRCGPPEVPDTAIPCYDSTLLGSTWRPQCGPDPLAPDVEEFKDTVDRVALMVPRVAGSAIDHGYSGVRAFLDDEGSPACALRRSARHHFDLRDHTIGPKSPPLISVFGGKLTLHAGMAASAASLVCERLGMPFRDRPTELRVSDAISTAPIHLGSLRRGPKSPSIDGAKS